MISSPVGHRRDASWVNDGYYFWMTTVVNQVL